MYQLTVLLENSVRKRSLKAEHGLSFWLELDGLCLLFDTGQTDLYCHNARQLGIDLSQADHLVLSHGHYDHGGGLASFPFQAADPGLKLHLHPDALLPRFAVRDGHQRFVGLDHALVTRLAAAGRLALSNQGEQLSDRLALHTYADHPTAGVSAGFLRQNQAGHLEEDAFLDECFLVIRGQQGLVVVCGCCHPGFEQLVHRVRSLYPHEAIDGIIGGFHLHEADGQQLDRLVTLLKTFNWRFLAPMHCTGTRAWCHLHQVFQDRCLLLQTGDRLSDGITASLPGRAP